METEPNGWRFSRGSISFFLEERRLPSSAPPALEKRPFFMSSSLVGAPVRLQDPWHDYLQYLRDSNQLVEKVYQIEKAGGLKDTGTPESREFLRERFAAGAQMLLNLWYTAWEESAVPVPPRNPPPSSGK